ncbi:MAG: helix-turn-helix transcriptional regulator [Alphaproteobacteria bacterium]|nr:helix-turn-helix transcriptional regulator [Alphaproteobacteria bacterium]
METPEEVPFGPPRDAQPSPGNEAALPPEADRIIEAALALIAAQGWRGLSLAAVAAEAGLPVLSVYRLFPSKQAILCGHYRRVDEAVLSAPPQPEPGERPRDRVFDLLMQRFDALQPHKAALEALRRDLPRDPPSALCLGAALLRSMRWMLEAAGIATGGLAGTVAVKLTAAAYLAAMRVWLRDDSPDLGRTMATLDARLRRVERWFGRDGRGAPQEPVPA